VSLAYVLAVVIHFLGNRHFTFKSFQQPVSQQIPRYLVLAVINYFVTISAMYAVVEIFHYSPYLGIIFGIGGTVITGYLLSRFWIFKRADKKCDIL